MEFLRPASKDGKKFLNPVPTDLATGSTMLRLLWKFFTNREETIPKNKPGPFKTDVGIYQKLPGSGLRVTWIGHSSVLAEIDGKRILIDPVWSKRASFSSLLGPKRFFPAPLKISELPPLDAIIISHDHYDHLDKESIKRLAQDSLPFYCSLGIAKYLIEWGVQSNRIREMNWMDEAAIGNNCKIIALPARHFSGRSLFNRFETLWSSFVITTNRHNVYYGADSGWFGGFKEIGETYGPFDLTMLEIGAYNPNWADIHMGPENAVNAHLALKGKLLMPTHWGTFNLALHAWNEPIEKLMHYADDSEVMLFIPEPGQPTEVTMAAYNSKWWLNVHARSRIDK